MRLRRTWQWREPDCRRCSMSKIINLRWCIAKSAGIRSFIIGNLQQEVTCSIYSLVDLWKRRGCPKRRECRSQHFCLFSFAFFGKRDFWKGYLFGMLRILSDSHYFKKVFNSPFPLRYNGWPSLNELIVRPCSEGCKSCFFPPIPLWSLWWMNC